MNNCEEKWKINLHLFSFPLGSVWCVRLCCDPFYLPSHILYQLLPGTIYMCTSVLQLNVWWLLLPHLAVFEFVMKIVYYYLKSDLLCQRSAHFLCPLWSTLCLPAISCFFVHAQLWVLSAWHYDHSPLVC